MIELLKTILSSTTVFKIGMCYTLVITVAVIILFFLKTSRDERGRAILGKASIFSTITFIVLMNVYAGLSELLIVDWLTMANGTQWMYNIVLTVQVAAILIYKKIE